ncbi:MAG: glycine cleavage system aminomethyltransferase GcvT [Candidatus Omnitrophica bacterium]|nr:glycine cleavage system aminomethyltransferase GcvT [Candidatus Omnitrophota bacterium]
MSVCSENLKKTALYGKHIEAGARMVAFTGWCMPVQYSGIIEEHLHTRQKAGLFDICHMGEFYVSGPSSRADLDRLLTPCMARLEEGKGRYGFMLNGNGGIIDDLIVFRTGEEEYLLVVNAGRVEADKRWIRRHLSEGSEFKDSSDETAKLDLQGPASPGILSEVIGSEEVKRTGRFCFSRVSMEGVPVMVSRTGYTGEDGFELFFPVEHAGVLWERFMSFDDVRPVGLGARATLRMEKGLSLYGNDIDEEHTPLEAGLARFVCMEKDFTGREALLSSEPEIRLTGFVCEGRRAARKGYNVIVNGSEAGEVTSGGFSPSLRKGIGFCYINREFSAPGQVITLIDAKGKVEIRAEIKAFPLI